MFKNAFSLPSPLLVLLLLEDSASEILVRRQFSGKKKEEKEIVNVDGQKKLIQMRVASADRTRAYCA